jgi:penicillin-binding protein 1C
MSTPNFATPNSQRVPAEAGSHAVPPEGGNYTVPPEGGNHTSVVSGFSRNSVASGFSRKVLWLSLAFATVSALWLRLGPLPAGLLDAPPPSTIVVDRNGVPLYEVRSSDGTRGIRLDPNDLPAPLVAATLAAEDRRFWSHPGLDPLATARAARINLVERAIVEGGSTITQQVAKLLLNRQDPERHRGWGAKIRESVIALRLEHRFDKREILAMYLNLAAYGNQIAGAERASRAYFGVPAAQLTHAQAAFLAGLPQRPTGFNPYRHRPAAISRQRVVLARMEAGGALTPGQAAIARDEQLTFRPSASPFVAPHFVEMVLAATSDRPERIVTTLDAALQADIAGVIESHREALKEAGANNVAVVVLDNRTSEWLAWEGSGAFVDDASGGKINGAIVPRQPGSALKPFTYALAFEQGHSPSSVLADIPSSFPTAEDGVVYSPRNYDGKFRGPMLARVALAGSENVPAVALASGIGVPKLLRFLSRAGMSTLEQTGSHYGLGLTLGNAEVRLDELTAAYSAFARGGEWLEPTWMAGRDGRELRRIVSPRTAFWIADILSDDEAREYAFGRGGSLEFPFPVAVKTGTSQSYHDNWTVGFSRHVTVGVWVGNFDRTPLRNSSGVTGAAPIFQGVMLAAERRAHGTTAPSRSGVLAPGSDTVQREICALSGRAANDWCPNRKREWVAAESAPLPCSWHHLADEGVVTYLPPEYEAWGAGASREVRVADGGGAGASREVRGADDGGAGASRVVPGFAIVSPADGSTYLIDPTLRREFQTLSLRAVAGAGAISWSVGGRRIATSDAGRPVEWPLTPGRHVIVARDARGRTAEASVTVR